MKYSTYIKPRIRTNIKPRFRWSFFFKRIFRWFLNYFRYILAAIGVGILVTIIIRSSILTFDMSKVKIQGVGNYISEDNFKSQVISQLKDKNLVDINTTDLENHLKDTFVGIKNISVKKKVPTYLTIDVIERIPEVLLVTNVFDIKEVLETTISLNPKDISSSKTYLVSDDGFVLAELNDSSRELFLKYKDLPKIDYSGEVILHSFISQNSISLYKDIYSGLSKTSLQATNIIFSKNLITVFLKEDVIVYIPTSKPIGNSFEVVYSIITKLSTEDKKVSKIDLRYDKVIVSYR